MILINESTDGVSVFGMDLAVTDTLKAYFPFTYEDSIGWAGNWQGYPHSYAITYDTVTDRNVPGLRGAYMNIRDTFDVAFTLFFDEDSAFEKHNFAVAGPSNHSALLVQLGTYGSIYHGWVLRGISHRKFRGPAGISPELREVTVTWGSTSWTLNTSLFNVDDIAEFAPGDSATIRVRTDNPADELFLNVHDGDPARRIPMNYDTDEDRHIAGWRISPSAPTRRFFQAFIEAYSPSSFTSLDSAAVGVAGHTFVYRIK